MCEVPYLVAQVIADGILICKGAEPSGSLEIEAEITGWGIIETEEKSLWSGNHRYRWKIYPKIRDQNQILNIFCTDML